MLVTLDKHTQQLRNAKSFSAALFIIDLIDQKCSGLVPEPSNERQASEDDMALWRPHACCVCPPGQNQFL